METIDALRECFIEVESETLADVLAAVEAATHSDSTVKPDVLDGAAA